jgi:metal-responsive CopG/Arc/MetJ family transcriptional regulator
MDRAIERKKNFSVSMKPREIERIDKKVEELSKETGFPVSRNELIRRATIAYLDFVEKGNKDYMEVFKGVSS